MKKILQSLLFTLFLILAISTVVAQAPEGVIYQAEARNASGDILSNETLDVKITILESSANGSIVWEATHQVITNNYGMFVLVIGTGTNLSGNAFEDISWENQSHFLNVKIKDNKSGTWHDMGTSQFLSVPYALHAKTASSLVSPNLKSGNKPGVNSQTWSLFGNSNTDPSKDVFGTTDPTDLLFVTNNTERLRIMADGNVNFKNALTCDGDFTAKQNVFLNTESGETVVNGTFNVANKKYSNLSGPLIVWGSTTMHERLYVTEDVLIGKTLFVQGKSGFNEELIVFNGSSTQLTGDLKVDKKVEINGSTIVNDSLTANGQVTINYDNPLGDASDYDEYALRIEGSKHGIGIKSTREIPSRHDNYITFFDKNGGAKGRIEGNSGLPGIITSWIMEALEPPATGYPIDPDTEFDTDNPPRLKMMDLTQPASMQ